MLSPPRSQTSLHAFGESPLLPAGLAGLDTDESARHQVEWEKEIENLDQKEMELHQSQLRLIREQTAIFIRDLASLRGEVATLKENLDAGVSTNVMHLQSELKDHKARSAQQDQHNASLQKRVDYLERLLGESADRHSQELETAKMAHARLASEVTVGRQAREAHHAGMAERLSFIEKLVGDSFEKHSQEIQDSHARLEQMHGRLMGCETQMSSLDGLKLEHSDVASQFAAHVQSREAAHTSLAERVNYLESLIGESADKNAEALNATHSRLEQIHGSVQDHLGSRMEQLHGSLKEKLDRLEKQLGDTDERRGRELEVHQSSVQARLSYLEQQFGDSADKHARDMDRQARELEQAKSKIDHAHSKLGDHQSSLQTHASLAERVSFVEKLLGDSADRHTEELGEAHAKLELLRGRLSAVEAYGATMEGLKKSHTVLVNEKAKRDAHHASMAERLDYMEKMLGDSADKHSREMNAALSKVEQANGRLSKMEKFHSTLSDQQRSHEASMADDRAAVHAHNATLKERVDYLENAMGDSADLHAREIENLKSAHSKLSTEAKAKEMHHASTAERLAYLEKMMGDSADQHAQELAAAHQKLEQMHTRVAACESTGLAVDGLKKSHASLASDKAARDAHHAGFAERLDYIERAMGDSADKHSREVKAAHDKLEQLHGRFGNLEKMTSGFHDLQQSHVDANSENRDKLNTIHASVNERLSYLEGVIGESADKHSKELEVLKTSYARMSSETKARDAHHASVAERLDFVEKALGDSADKHAQELKVAHAKIDQVQSKVSGKLHEETFRSLLNNEKEARQKHHASVEERLENLEKVMGDTHDKHTREIETTKSNNARLTKELKARDDRHATFAERLEYLESKIGDSADLHARELKAAQSKLEQMHNRLSECEKVGHSVVDLQRSHGSSSQEQKMALAAHHASLSERLDFLERSLGESADRHAKEVETLKASHSRMTTDSKARDAHHASVAERLDYVEKSLGDSADKHARELQAAHAKLSEMHSRVLECEARGTHIDSIRQAHAKMAGEQATRDSQHSSVNERLDYLEKMVGDSADHHKKEIQAARQAQEQLHARLHEEKQLREQAHSNFEIQISKEREGRGVHHASIEERLQKLEQLHTEHQEQLAGLRDQVHTEAASRNQLHESVVDQLAHERRAREGHERSVQSHLAGERKAREVHENLVNENFTNEKAARDRNHAHVQDLIAREKDARDKHHEHHQELLGRERAANEGRHRDLHEVIQKERTLREQHHGMVQDMVHKERASRVAIEELLAQEKADRNKVHGSIEERVDGIQKTMGVFDSLIRKEIEERTKEYRRIWDAIDNHTHDLSTQVIPEPGNGWSGELSATAAEAPPLLRAATPPTPTAGNFAWTSSQSKPFVYSAPERPLTVVPPATAPGVVRQVAAPVVRMQSPIRSGSFTPQVPGVAAGTQCPNCGNIYMSDAMFCRHCGQKRGEPTSPHLSLGSGVRDY